VEEAIGWLEEHADMPEPTEEELAAEQKAQAESAAVANSAAPAAVAPSNDSTGSGNGDAAHASNFTVEEMADIAAAEAGSASGTQASKRMTPEEAKAFVERRRREKAEKAKEDARLAEIRRREDGKKHTEMQQEIAKLQRQRDADVKKREADAQRREKDRLRVELLKDKIERYERRNEPVPQDLHDQLAAAVAAYNGLETTVVAKAADPRMTIKAALASLAQFKREQAGLKAAETLKKLVTNALNNPSEPKFQSVNLSNAIVKERIVDLTGGLRFLKAVGFVKDEETNIMHLTPEHRDDAVLRIAIEEVNSAVAAGAFNEF
jgi:hypothetical protein